jgi:hypothetical protein
MSTPSPSDRRVVKSSGTERRRNPRAKRPAHVLKIYLDHGSPNQAEISLLDVGPNGVGVETPEPLAVGSRVSVTGEISRGSVREKIHGNAHVLWCLPGQNGAYSAGLSFDDASGPR